jgi:hypothetical protein
MIRTLQIAAIAVSSLFLVLVVGLIALEFTWTQPDPATPRDYFLYGSTGTELMPLPVFQVLPDLFPDQFQPAGKDAGDWIDQFGFVRGQPGVNEGLPAGINISKYRPGSGAPSPVPFVGFNCSACHVSKIRRSEGDEGVIVVGMGNASVDLVAFGDAIKTSLLDEDRLTVANIAAAYQSKYKKSLGPLDKLLITLWLSGARKEIKAQIPMRNQPFGGADLRNAALFTSGPGRNQPMRETVRFLIQQTPSPDGGASKIPCLYQQDQRQWAQFDGSVGDPITRNSLAALGVGASIDNLKVQGILNTMRQTYTFVATLQGPKFSDLFPGKDGAIDTARANRGSALYREHCGDCHGWPGNQPGEWVKGKRQGVVVPATEVGTDDARVSFRFYPGMAQLIFDFFPAGHPLKPERNQLRPNAGDPHGYITAPIEAPVTRAPYFHNGSVPTLAEVINLKPRPTLFYRGRNLTDPVDVGLLVSSQPDVERYFRYDTAVYGNSNRGHDYPWQYHGPGWKENALKDLLEYLKTL